MGGVPVLPVGAPEKTELLDEAVRVDRETISKESSPGSQTTPLFPSPTDIFFFKTFSCKY